MRRLIVRLAAVTALAGGSLVAVGASIPGSTAGASVNATPLGSSTPTFVGPAATGCASGCTLLTGPNIGPSTLGTASSGGIGGGSHPTPPSGGPDAPAVVPFHSIKKHGGPNPAPPTVSCVSGSGCSAISSSAGGATGVPGLDAVDSASMSTNPLGIDIEPSDQGLCAGNGYVVESDNIGEVQVFDSGLANPSAVIPLDTMMGFSSAAGGLDWSSAGDISCAYDQSNGGHFFFTEIVSASPESAGGPFAPTGCFEAAANACYEGIAVSQGNNPYGPYWVYYLNANYNPAENGAPYLLNDFAKIATSQDAFLIFYDEFPFTGGFNGAQELAFDKNAMETGAPVFNTDGSVNQSFNVAIENMGTLPAVPGSSGACDTGLGSGPCWYSVIPVEPPDSASWDNANGGSAFMLATLDFNGTGDTRTAGFAWTNLSELNSTTGCAADCGDIAFSGTLFTGTDFYYGEGTNAFQGAQKVGPIPLGSECRAAGLLSPTNNPNGRGSRNGAGGSASCPEGKIATNGDNVTQASQSNGELWATISTAVNQSFKGGAANSEVHQGVYYFEVGTSSFDTTGVLSFGDQGYISAAHEDLEMPSVAASDSGQVMADFTLSGNGGPHGADNGGFYPSTAWTDLTSGTPGAIHIVDLGLAPQDGFSEYQGYTGNQNNPGVSNRWGDYSAAVYSNGTFYFAGGYIASAACTGAAFTLTIGTCGGTRDGFANWGTSVNSVSAASL